MEKEFVDYWNTHQNHLILNAPEGLRKEYFDSNRLDTPIDWICFLIPIAVGILLQTFMGDSQHDRLDGNHDCGRGFALCSDADGEAVFFAEKI